MSQCFYNASGDYKCNEQFENPINTEDKDTRIDCLKLAKDNKCQTDSTMLKSCPQSCRLRDTNVNCSQWAKKGECSINSDWMLSFCPESCIINRQCLERVEKNECVTNSNMINICPEACANKDKNKACPAWAKAGVLNPNHCSRNEDTLKLCPESCANEDKDTTCENLASYGNCKNPSMRLLCPTTCKIRALRGLL